MDYKIWAEDYLAQAQLIKEKISALKKEEKDNPEENRMERNRRATILYSMYLDCQHTAAFLTERGNFKDAH